MSAPPFFDRIVPERACSRAITTDGDPCGAEAFLHIAWCDTPEGIESGYVCTEHARDAERWPALVHNGIPQVHEIGPDCGMPGAQWFLDENVCRVPDEPELVAARTEGRVPLAIGEASSALPR